MITKFAQWSTQIVNESYNSSNYDRVIPRDFFNESKLLKCMGQLSLKILDNQVPEGISINIEEIDEPFDIKMNNDGMLYVSNYPVSINDEDVFVGTLYNSKAPYPLVVISNNHYESDDYVETEIFDDNGNFTKEFVEVFTHRVPNQAA